MEEGTVLSPTDKLIRKLRKKLRQIENLEFVDRQLNEEEFQKVSSKKQLRKDLQKLLQNHQPDEGDVMKRQWLHQKEEGGQQKKAKNIEGLNIKKEPADEGNTEATVTAPDREQPKGALDVSEAHPTTQPLAKSTIDRDAAGSSQQAARGSSASGKSNRKTSNTQTQPTVSQAQQLQSKHIEEEQEKCLWRDGVFETLTLEGHNDIILAVDCLDDYILSASRDTTVRVWRLGRTVEERSLRGHTAAVTVVAFLPPPLAPAILAKFDDIDGDLGQERISSERQILAVSGSLDCTLKVWDIVSGESRGSIYTYNGITSLACGDWGVVTGTEGGKLEVWNLASAQQLTYVNAFHNQVTTIQVVGEVVYAGSSDGEVGIWGYQQCHLVTQYLMESASSSYVPLRQLATLLPYQHKLFLGDGGPNIKVVHWKKGQVGRLMNHLSDVGLTDCLALHLNRYLLSSSYSIDSGCPSINVRDVTSNKYICSLLDGEEGRYLALSCSPGVIVTGGHYLRVWRHQARRPVSKNKTVQQGELVEPVRLQKLLSPALESASEDDTDWATSSEEEQEEQEQEQESNSGGWWCQIV